MPSHAFRIHGAGCGMADFLHGETDFSSPRLDAYRSRALGDGGLAMGKVTFQNDLVELAALRRAAGEAAGADWEAILADITGPDAPAPDFNVGGPALAALTLAAQILRRARVPVTFYGASGDDGDAARIRHLLAQTPLDMTCYRRKPGRTTAAHVFSDARAAVGGDRCFVHRQGDDFPLDDVFQGESFFQAVFNLYAGTALVPALHRALPGLLQKSRRRGALTIVGTVHDYAAEKSAPGRPWPLGGEGGEDAAAFPCIDLLVGDAEEIRGLAGSQAGIEACVDLLLARGLTTVVATNGADPVYYRSLGGIFGECRGHVAAHPALAALAADRRGNPGDTCGAGDNFLGGLAADLMDQLLADDFYPKGEPHIERELLEVMPLHLRRAIEFACVAGGLACLQSGGVRLEKASGEALGRIRQYLPKPIAAKRPW